MTSDEVLEFCRWVRNHCSRGKPLEGATFCGLQVVVCPTWEEREKLTGKGVFPMQADELEAMLLSGLTRDQKIELAVLMLEHPGMRILGLEKRNEE